MKKYVELHVDIILLNNVEVDLLDASIETSENETPPVDLW